MTLSSGTGAVLAPLNGKRLLSASANFQKQNIAGASEAECWLSVSSNRGVFKQTSASAIRTFSAESENQSVSVTAGTSVTAGVTCNAALTCASSHPEVKFVAGDLTATFIGA